MFERGSRGGESRWRIEERAVRPEGISRVRAGGVDKKKKKNKRVGAGGGLEDAHLTEQGEPKRGAVRRPDLTNDTEMGFSLFLFPFSPPAPVPSAHLRLM